MMNMNAQEKWRPNWATHPGQHLEEHLDVRGFRQAEFARVAGLTPKLVSDIINKKNPVTPETAIALERVLGLKAYIWTGLQANWDLFQAQQKARIAAKEHKSWLERFPVRDLKARGVLSSTNDEGTLLDELLKFLGVGKPEAYSLKLAALSVHHRKSTSYESLQDHVFTWLMLGEKEARSRDLPSFDAESFTNAVLKIRSLTKESPEIFGPEMVKLCHDAGVAVVFEKPIGRTCLFGSTRWLDRERAVIQMSLRMKTNDHFWWTFFHECGHILMHRGQNFADDKNAEGDGIEKEADRWAESILYGKEGVSPILDNPPKSEAAIRRLADAFRLHPGIVVGMLQHYRVISHAYCNNLKDTFEWKEEKPFRV
jgi:HTH-type transcriptional regulator/antitoxin HigA